MDMVRSYVSSGVEIKNISSLNHLTTAPAINTLPSRAYLGLFSVLPAARVVRRPFFEAILSSPVFIRRKQPVPYVFFASPFSKQHWPNNAACWSPATPHIIISSPNTVLSVVAKLLIDGLTSGSMLIGILK